MSVLEINGGPITYKYLMNKSKDELASMVLDYVRRIDPATIQPADDPRKAMLDEIRSKLRRTPIIKYRGASGYLTITVDSILDELESKL